MKRAILATLGFAVAMLLGVTLFSRAALASDPDHNDEITIASAQNGQAVAVGSTFTFTLAVTKSTDPAAGYKSIQWEVAYPNNAAFVSATYSCASPGGPNFPAETDTAPSESPLLPGVNNLGGGSNCASLSGTFSGTHNLGVFVTVVLQCNSVLSSTGMAGDAVVVRPQNEPANIANDASFGTTLGDATGAVIATDLAPQVPVPGFGTQAAVFFACAQPVDYSVTKTPATQNVSGDAPNNVVTQTIAIANPDMGAHAVFLNDTLPSGVTTVSVAPGPGASCTVGPAPAAAGPGPTPPYYGPGPYSGAPAGHIVCIGSAPGGGSLSAVITYSATPALDCSTLTNSVVGGPGDATTADAGNDETPDDSPLTASATAVVDCPNLTVTKTASSTEAFTDDNVTYTITVSNDGPATGSTAHSVVLNDTLDPGQTFVSATPPCAGGFPCALGDIPANGSVTITVVVKMPSTAGQSCDTASATQNAPGPGASSAKVCITVKSKFPFINGFAKDTGITPLCTQADVDKDTAAGLPAGPTRCNKVGDPNPHFLFTVGNIFLCKPLDAVPSEGGLPPVGGFSGAGETACGTFKIAEIVQEPADIDTCNDQEVEAASEAASDPQPVDRVHHTGGPDAPCAGKPGTPPAPWQDQNDICLNVASDYIPGVTAVNCETGENGINGTGELPEGLGAAEFQVKFDDKIFQSPTFDCAHTPTGGDAILATPPRLLQTQVSIITENWVMFGCVTKNPQACESTGFPGAAGTTFTATSLHDTAPPACLSSATSTQFTGQQVVAGACSGVIASVNTPTPGTITLQGSGWSPSGCLPANGTAYSIGRVMTPGPDITNGAILGTLTLKVQPDLLSRMRPAKDNGVTTNILDENCEKADTLGQPFNQTLGAFGQNSSPSGGLSQDCKDAALTIRMLEGDVNLDCQVNILDDQMMAFRYGQFFGQLLYNRFFDLEPNISPDFDIDIKDLQTVFGRNGSTCQVPIPAQNPVPAIPDP